MLGKSICLFLLLVATACQHEVKPNCFRINLNCEPPTLDSRKATDTTSMNVLLQLFEGLTRFDREDQPQLAGAESLDISQNGRVYTFTLRDHLWSNGEPVTAYDYVESWRSLLHPDFPSPFAYKLFCIEGAEDVKHGSDPEMLAVKAFDRQTLQITLRHPIPYFLELLALPTFYPLHVKTALDQPNWAAEAGSFFVCNGPFKLRSWEHENEIILEKNPFYWDEKKVELDTIQMAIIPDVTTEYYLFENGQLDWAGSPLSTIPLEFIPALREKNALHFYKTEGVYFYKINCDFPPLNNVKVRRALALAMNRQKIVDHLLQANQQIATALVPGEHSFFADHHESARTLFYEGLQEEGFSTPPTLTLSYNTNSQHQKIAQAIQQQWHTVLGLTVQLESCDWKVYLNKIATQNYQIARLGWVGEYHDPISHLEPYVSRDHENNETGWENPHFSALIEQSYLEIDQKKRLALLEEAESILMEEMPIIPLYFLDYAYLKNPCVENVNLSSLGMIDLKEARVNR